MKENWIKTVVRSLFFRRDAIRTILFGPMRGMVFRVGPVTGISPWYSGVERAQQRFFKALLHPRDVVMDVGANWGIHTLYLSRLVGKEGLVVAIEPSIESYNELEWHILENDCPNVKAVQLAISDRNGDARFVPDQCSQTGSLAVVYLKAFQEEATILVKTQTLDSVVEELQLESLRLIKIDVEGAEAKVLLGAQKTIQQFHPYFLVELHTPEQDVQVAQFLISRCYQLKRITRPPILRTDVGWPERTGVWGTILAVPPPL